MKKCTVTFIALLFTICVTHAKTIGDFKAEYGDNYIGYIEESVMIEECSEFDEHLIQEVCASVVRDSKTYYRCGTLIKGFGTQVTEEQFNKLWWTKFGGKMLTEEELLALPNPEVDEFTETL